MHADSKKTQLLVGEINLLAKFRCSQLIVYCIWRELGVNVVVLWTNNSQYIHKA